MRTRFRHGELAKDLPSVPTADHVCSRGNREAVRELSLDVPAELGWKHRGRDPLDNGRTCREGKEGEEMESLIWQLLAVAVVGLAAATAGVVYLLVRVARVVRSLGELVDRPEVAGARQEARNSPAVAFKRNGQHDAPARTAGP